MGVAMGMGHHSTPWYGPQQQLQHRSSSRATNGSTTSASRQSVNLSPNKRDQPTPALQSQPVGASLTHRMDASTRNHSPNPKSVSPSRKENTRDSLSTSSTITSITTNPNPRTKPLPPIRSGSNATLGASSSFTPTTSSAQPQPASVPANNGTSLVEIVIPPDSANKLSDTTTDLETLASYVQDTLQKGTIDGISRGRTRTTQLNDDYVHNEVDNFHRQSSSMQETQLTCDDLDGSDEEDNGTLQQFKWAEVRPKLGIFVLFQSDTPVVVQSVLTEDIHKGDHIMRIGKHTIHDFDSFEKCVQELETGKLVTIQVKRDGKILYIPLLVGGEPKHKKNENVRRPPPPQLFGPTMFNTVSTINTEELSRH
eukprot:TRINITY_DN84339_c0_g1_i1.p1 TRINITY_DN84339_c0_g1~~TRINITY_DN84339_c0_g1_i1.p1  ORF type:complete len:368 (-),score=44.68 TRINITY_DN84339_c0_g1_i1:263-1366(-)